MVKRLDGKTWMNNQEFMEMADEMIEAVEEILNKYEIVVPNEEKEEIDGASNIYGTDYGYLSDSFEAILKKHKVLERDYDMYCTKG